MPFARFMELALYHPTVGYYRRDQPRVGYDRGTDFFTAAASSEARTGFRVSAVTLQPRDTACLASPPPR